MSSSWGDQNSSLYVRTRLIRDLYNLTMDKIRVHGERFVLRRDAGVIRRLRGCMIRPRVALWVNGYMSTVCRYLHQRRRSGDAPSHIRLDHTYASILWRHATYKHLGYHVSPKHLITKGLPWWYIKTTRAFQLSFQLVFVFRYVINIMACVRCLQ